MPITTPQDLIAASWTDPLDRLGQSRVEVGDRYAGLAAARPVIDAAQSYLKTQYGIQPNLVGSLPLGLSVPNDVDIDMSSLVQDRDRYLRLIEQLSSDAHFKPSPYNKPGVAHNVYTAPAGAFGELPVDLAVSTGPGAEAFAAAHAKRLETARGMSDAEAAELIKRKAMLRNTLFDAKGYRYKKFKNQLNAALEGAEKPTKVFREKLARILSVSDPHVKNLLESENLYGHRTAHGDALLESGRLMSGIEALQKGKLQSYESGFIPGMRGKFEIPDLTRQQLDQLQKAWLKDTPDYNTVDAVGHPRDALKGALLRDRAKDVRKYLRGLDPDTAEKWRREHLRISKLSPHIFLTQGGLVDDEGYGDTGFLFRSNTATSSPFLTLIKNEAVISPRHGLDMRGVNLRNALVVAPDDKIEALDAARPDYDYLRASELKDTGKLMSVYDPASAARRAAEHIQRGTFKILQG